MIRFALISLSAALVSASSADSAFSDKLIQESPNALVTVSVASLRAEPSHCSELETQALCGTPVVADTATGNPDWYRCLLPDGYEAFIHRSAVAWKDSTEIRNWRNTERLIVTSVDEIKVIGDTVDAGKGSVPVTDLVLGCIVEGMFNPGSHYAEVKLPDGRHGYVSVNDVDRFAERMKAPLDYNRVVNIARRLNGVPYLWGGTSTKSPDCSGLTRICYFDVGVLLPRNASQQGLSGEAVNDFIAPGALETGDLLFFENERGRITHVGIYSGNNRYMHASGTVHESSMLPDDSLYNGRTVTSARRIKGDDLPYVKDHPWYFNLSK